MSEYTGETCSNCADLRAHVKTLSEQLAALADVVVTQQKTTDKMYEFVTSEHATLESVTETVNGIIKLMGEGNKND